MRSILRTLNTEVEVGEMPQAEVSLLQQSEGLSKGLQDLYNDWVEPHVPVIWVL